MLRAHLFEVNGETWIATESSTYKLDEHLNAADEIAALETQNASQLAMLERLEWSGTDTWMDQGDLSTEATCTVCESYPDVGHAHDCELAALIAQAKDA